MDRRLVEQAMAGDRGAFDELARDELENDMRRLTRFLITLSMGAGLLLAAAPASLAGSVDPSTLQPPPPPGAKCHTAGNQIICDTILNFDLENQPDFDLPCGTLYLTGTDYREGFRFYVDGKIVRRHVTGAFNVTGSLSPTGDGPTIRLIARWNIWSVWPIPGGGDDDAIAIERGLSLRAIGPGLGSDFHISGQFDAEGNHSGLFTAFSDESMDALCEALDA